MASRKNIEANFVDNALNDRVRQIIDNRTFWADLMKFGILSFPDPYTTGTVSVSTGSNIFTGVGTTWPFADLVNTSIPGGVPEYGYVEVTPSSMNGIVENSLLYVYDIVDGLNAEVVPVVQVNRTSFIAKFEKTHVANCNIAQSSLANRQIRLSQQYPIFTVLAVTSPTQILSNLPWGGPALAGQTYTINLMYPILAGDLKGIIAMKDEQTGYPIRIHISRDEADYRDPRRTMVSGNPRFSLVDLGSNDQGNMLYEMWPAPGAARQFSYAYWKQWPPMVKDTDRPPPFINPSILYYGALADAKMMRLSKDDAYYDPKGAEYYEGKFLRGLQEAKNADEAKCLEALQSSWWKSIMGTGNYDQMQLNDPAVAGFWSDW